MLPGHKRPLLWLLPSEVKTRNVQTHGTCIRTARCKSRRWFNFPSEIFKTGLQPLFSPLPQRNRRCEREFRSLSTIAAAHSLPGSGISPAVPELRARPVRPFPLLFLFPFLPLEPRSPPRAAPQASAGLASDTVPGHTPGHVPGQFPGTSRGTSPATSRAVPGHIPGTSPATSRYIPGSSRPVPGSGRGRLRRALRGQRRMRGAG